MQHRLFSASERQYSNADSLLLSAEDSKYIPIVNNEKNVVKISETKSVEQDILTYEPHKSSFYTIKWPEPSKLLVLLISKRLDKFASCYAYEIVDFLSSHKVHVAIEPVIADSIKPKENIYVVGQIDLSKVNAIITVGGDSTVLWALRYYKYSSLPPMICFHLVFLNHSNKKGA